LHNALVYSSLDADNGYTAKQSGDSFGGGRDCQIWNGAEPRLERQFTAGMRPPKVPRQSCECAAKLIRSRAALDVSAGNNTPPVFATARACISGPIRAQTEVPRKALSFPAALAQSVRHL
jgi:hypothetical protein